MWQIEPLLDFYVDKMVLLVVKCKSYSYDWIEA